VVEVTVIRDEETVILDVLSAMAQFHDSNFLGERYFNLYQAVGSFVLAPEYSTTEEHLERISKALEELPESDRKVMNRVLIVLTERLVSRT
jgi:hypothetical protein